MKKLIALIISIPLYFVLFLSTTHAQELIQQYEPVVIISNVTSLSFTVSWFSEGKADQAVIIGQAEPLSTWATDDRGAFIERTTHHVTVKNLTPDTEYLFRINNTGKTYKQRTAKKITVENNSEKRFIGTIFTEDKTAPAEAIVYLKVAGGNLLSLPSNTQGQWVINTRLMRTENLENYLKIEGTDYVNLFVRAGFEGEASAQVFGLASQAPLNFNLSEVRVPFYKIILPGLLTNSQPQSTQTLPEQTPIPEGDPATPASNPGFFQTIWSRIGELF